MRAILAIKRKKNSFFCFQRTSILSPVLIFNTESTREKFLINSIQKWSTPSKNYLNYYDENLADFLANLSIMLL